MISARAVDAIDWLFEKAVSEHCCREGQPPSVIAIRHERPAPVEQTNRHVVAINISSYLFRITLFFNFSTDRESIAYLARLSRCNEDSLEGQTLFDAYAEFVNMICGAANRDLHASFPHTGMSTPTVLDKACLHYLPLLKPVHVSQIEVGIGAGAGFLLTLCVCTAKEARLDFDLERTALPEPSSGEIEFF